MPSGFSQCHHLRNDHTHHLYVSRNITGCCVYSLTISLSDLLCLSMRNVKWGDAWKPKPVTKAWVDLTRKQSRRISAGLSEN